MSRADEIFKANCRDILEMRLHGRVDAAVMRDDEHEAERQRRRGKRDERRDRTAHGKADEDDEEI